MINDIIIHQSTVQDLFSQSHEQMVKQLLPQLQTYLAQDTERLNNMVNFHAIDVFHTPTTRLLKLQRFLGWRREWLQSSKSLMHA